MKNDQAFIHRVSMYIPWLIIVIGGSIGFFRVEQIQNQIIAEQATAANQLKFNKSVRARFDADQEKERLARAQIIKDATLKQCVSEFQTDENLITLADDIVADSSHSIDSLTNEKSRSALSLFASELFKEKSQMNCNPVVPPKGVAMPK